MDPITFSIHGPMVSGQGEVAAKTFKKVEAPDGDCYYIAVQPNSADNIYVKIKNVKNSQGFGGGMLDFLLEDGTTDKVQGPWHTNAGDLFHSTGVDIQDKYLTRGIVALKHQYGEMCSGIYDDVIHFDEEPAIGTFHRIRDIAQDYANKNYCIVYYAVKSAGGGSAGSVSPKI